MKISEKGFNHLLKLTAMKTPEKNQKKQGSSDSHGPKASADKNKQAANKDKGVWKNPDPTHPKKSPEKVNEPYAKTPSTFPGSKTAKTQTPGDKKEKITNAGESEHHIPVNKSDYEKFEDEYEDFELDTEDEEEEEEEEEDGETSSHYEYEEEDEDRQFRSQVPLNQKSQVPLNQKNQVPVNQKKASELSKLHQPTNKTFDNKNKSQLPSNSASGKNKKNPQA